MLASLKNQTLRSSDWEVVLVDNASQVPLDEEHLASFLIPAPVRVVREPRPGVAYAQTRGIEETSGELVVFVDDDSELDPSYLERAWEVSRARPDLGAFGAGQILSVFEGTPDVEESKLLHEIFTKYTDRELIGDLPQHTSATPSGLGMCVRRSVADAYVKIAGQSAFRRGGFGRKGTWSLTGGDDLELAYTACDLGMKLAVLPELKMRHFIAPHRCKREYLIRFAEGLAYSKVFLDAIHYDKMYAEMARRFSPWKDYGLPSLKCCLRDRGLQRQWNLAFIKGDYRAKKELFGKTAAS